LCSIDIDIDGDEFGGGIKAIVGNVNRVEDNGSDVIIMHVRDVHAQLAFEFVKQSCEERQLQRVRAIV
jgi:hypothetical protein